MIRSDSIKQFKKKKKYLRFTRIYKYVDTLNINVNRDLFFSSLNSSSQWDQHNETSPVFYIIGFNFLHNIILTFLKIFNTKFQLNIFKLN